jgi:hypothetical protein
VSFQEEIDKFIHIEGGRNLPNGKFARNEMLTLDQIKGYLSQHGKTGMYLSAYRYDNPNVNEARLYGDFYLDFDSEDNFELARQDAIRSIWYLKQKSTYDIPEKFVRIYFSGKKGLHVTIPADVFGVEPDTNLNEYYKVMAKRISDQLMHGTLDEKIYDRRRLFRIPGSKHHDTGVYKIGLTYFDLVTLSFEEIKKKAEEPIFIQYAKAYEIKTAKNRFQSHIQEWKVRFAKKFDDNRKFESKPLDFTPACIQELIESGPIKGQRNNTAAVLSSFWKKQGNTEQGVWDLLVKWNNDSMPEWELKNTMKSVISNNYEYGCSTLETLATCIGNKCPLFRGKQI